MVSPRFWLVALLCAFVMNLSGEGQAAPLCADVIMTDGAAVLTADELRRAAERCLQQGERAEAIALLEKISAAEQLPADAVKIGAMRISLGKEVKGAIASLLAIDPVGLERAERLRRWQALLQGMAGGAERFNALAVIGHSLPLADPAEKAELCRQEEDLLLAATSEELGAYAGRFGASAVRYDLQTEMARRALEKHDKSAVRKLLDEALNGSLPFCRRSEALSMRDALEGGVWLRRAVGVILPLQDRFAPFGEAVQRGIDMALAERPPKAPPVAFVLWDRGSDPEENRSAVTQLCNEERVMAIIGPLTGGAALAAAGEAERLKIPLLALAQKEGVPEVGEYVFRDALTSRRQVEALVRFAMDEGRKRFAILAPDSRLGQEFADLFSEAVNRHGGTLVARQTYLDSDSDFRTPVKLLKGEDPAIPDPKEREARNRVRIAPAPALPFDALFIPDVGERIALISSYLAYYGVENIQLLGTSAWNSPELLEGFARYVEGAVFVDGFYPGSAQPRVLDFVARYSERYGSEPTVLEAEGYDLARLFISLLESGTVRSRSELRSALAKMKSFPGVGGDLAFDSTGEAVKRPVLLRIQGGVLTAAE